jgi:hypothetical protein
LADNPRGAYRGVSVLVVAAFLVSFIAILAQATLKDMETQVRSLPNNTIGELVSFDASAERRVTAWHTLQMVEGIHAFPAYIDNPEDRSADLLMACQDAQLLRFDCPDGSVIKVGFMGTIPDRPELAAVDMSSLPDRPIGAFSIEVTGGQNSLERLRTIRTQYPDVFSSGFTMMTTQELRADDKSLLDTVQQVINGAFSLVLFVAGCSLAVTVAGSLVERKRPFGLLRVAGTSLGQLRQVVLLESAMPLVVSSVAASALGMGVAALMVKSFFSPASAHIYMPSMMFFGLMGAGLVTALLIIVATLPMLNAMTRPEKVRFE